MAKVSVYNKQGDITGEIEIDDSIFGIEPNEDVVHMCVVAYLANQRQGTKSSKTRAEVRGGGRKPWRQKGTGRARHGSIRSPIWKGGGVIFAPKPRDFSKKLNKKTRRLGVRSVLSQKVLEEKLIVVDDLQLDTIKTKEVKNIIDALNLKEALIVLENTNDYKNTVLSARNLPNVKTMAADSINVYEMLNYDHFVVTKEAIEIIQEVYA